MSGRRAARARGEQPGVAPAIREAVRQVDSRLAVERPQLLSDVPDRSLGGQRLMATLIGLFGAVAWALAVLVESKVTKERR